MSLFEFLIILLATFGDSKDAALVVSEHKAYTGKWSVISLIKTPELHASYKVSLSGYDQ